MHRIATYGGPVALGALMGYLSDWGDHFLLQYFHGAEQVGFFQAGYQAILALMALAAPVSVVFLPKLVDQMRHDPQTEADYIRRVVPIVVIFWLMMIFPCIAIIPWIFSAVFGDNFQVAQPALLILCIAVPGSIFTYLYTVLFNIQGRSGWPALYIGAMSATNFAVSFALVPSMGGLGAAAGTAISYLLVQSLYMLDQHRQLSVNAFVPGVLFVLACAFGVVQWIIGDQIVWRLLWTFACMGLLLLLARKFRIAEFDVVSRLLPQRFALIARALDRILTKS